MTRACSTMATLLAFAVLTTSSAIGQTPGGSAASGPPAMPRHVKSATAVGEVFGDGEKISAAIVEYDRDIDQSKLSPAAFAVVGRTITKVYANKEPAKATRGTSGRYVVIELSPADADAPLFVVGPGAGRGPGTATRKPLKVSVAQVGDIMTASGEKYPADATPFVTDKGVNLIVDEFRQFEFRDPATGMTLAYNLFIPKNYDRNKSYPLVLFMHDASVHGAETTRTLTQGLGAVIWATPSEQAKHPSIVVAPQFPNGVSTEGEVGDKTGDTVVHLVESITRQYNVDSNRMYTTGQSFGCMLSLAIMIRHPDLFAASMLVAGQRDAQATSVLDHNKMWIIVAEGDTRAFPGMNDSIAVWEKQGTKVSKATWNARGSDAELSATASKMLAESNNIKYATFLKGTVFPEGQQGGIEHMATWPVAYRIESVRDWLFAQTKSPAKQAASSESADAHIVDVTPITRIYADGLKVAAIAVQYDRNISDASLAPADFAVQTSAAGQRITRVYTSNDGLQASGRALNGKYVILELSTDFELPVPVHKAAAPPTGPPPAPPAAAGPRPEPVKETTVLNSEVVAQVGKISWDPSAHPATLKASGRGGNGESVSVRQSGEIAATDGMTLTATTAARDNVYVRNLILDGFMKPDFASPTQGNVKYNIHFPSQYDPKKSYPMVVYLSDTDSPSGYTHAEYLIHGLGAAVWADKEDDARHPAIVLVPTYSRPLINEKYEPTVATRPGGQSSTPYISILELLDDMMDRIPNVDRSRVYLTGQGDGARAAMRMLEDRPNMFAAALLFAPDYDASRTAQLSRAKLWIVASEGDTASAASMDAYTAALKAGGTRVGKAEWSGRATPAQSASAVRSLAAVGSNVRYAVLKKGTVVPAGMPDDTTHNHAYTWRIGYALQPLRDWLFAQNK